MQKSKKISSSVEKLGKIEKREKRELLTLILPVIAAGIDRLATVMEKSSDTAAAVRTKRLEIIGTAGEAGVVEMLKAEAKGNEVAQAFLDKAIETARTLGNRRLDILEKRSEVMDRTEEVKAQADLLNARAWLLEEERLAKSRKEIDSETLSKARSKNRVHTPFVDLSEKD